MKENSTIIGVAEETIFMGAWVAMNPSNGRLRHATIDDFQTCKIKEAPQRLSTAPLYGPDETI